MKKHLVLLLSAAVAIMGMVGCTPKEPDLKKTDYLRLVHNTLGMTETKADKTLTRKGFVSVERSVEEDGLPVLFLDKVYEFAGKDSTVCLTVGLKVENDSVKQYAISGELVGTEHLTEAKTLYSDWSTTAYESLFGDLTFWSGACYDADYESDMTIYTDGVFATTLSSLLTYAYAAGQIDEETYNLMKVVFEHDHDDFVAERESLLFLQQENAAETYAHSTTALDLTTLMSGGLRNLKGNIGMLYGGVENEGTPQWTIVFAYMGEQDLSEYMEMLPEF